MSKPNTYFSLCVNTEILLICKAMYFNILLVSFKSYILDPLIESNENKSLQNTIPRPLDMDIY